MSTIQSNAPINNSDESDDGGIPSFLKRLPAAPVASPPPPPLPSLTPAPSAPASKLKAKQAGDTKAMPLTGRAALAEINELPARQAIAEEVQRTLAPGSWRAVLPIHRAAEKIPVATDEEKRSLAGDIKRHGLKVPVTLVSVAGGKPQLLDGRHRLDLSEGTGTKVIDADGTLLVLHETVNVADDAEAERLSLSLNAHRRQMKEVEWRKLLQAQLLATPEKSNRQIGAIIGVSHPTVAAERKKLESTGKALPVEKTVGADGKARKQPKAKKKPPPEGIARDRAAMKGLLPGARSLRTIPNPAVVTVTGNDVDTEASAEQRKQAAAAEVVEVTTKRQRRTPDEIAKDKANHCVATAISQVDTALMVFEMALDTLAIDKLTDRNNVSQELRGLADRLLAIAERIGGKQ